MRSVKYSWPEIVVFAVAALLPTYLIRFRIGPFPTTALEIVLVMAIGAMIVQLTHPASDVSNSSLVGRSESDHTSDLSYNKRGSVSELIRENKLLAAGSTLILIATITGIIVAPDKRAALGIAKAYFWEPMALAWLIIASKPDREKIKRAATWGFVASAGAIVVYGLIQYAFPALIPATWTAERRITSIFDYPNAAALYLSPLVPLFFSLPFGAFLSLAALAIIILAKSAGGLIAAAAALFFLGVAKKRTRLITLVIAAVAIVIVAFAPQAIGLREQILMRDWSGRVHQIGWKESLAMLRDRPLFGAGLDGFRTVVAPYHHAQGVEIFQYPHNFFLATWSELGLLGIIGFGCIIIWFFRQAYVLRSKFYVLCLAASMIAFLVHGLVDVPYYKNDLAMMFWLFIVLVAL
jgi:hypothetical protein